MWISISHKSHHKKIGFPIHDILPKKNDVRQVQTAMVYPDIM
uniref:Uncharacterized protein n=1 Tax=Arundo donax TaxID=35708 RepID=A0A0A9H043_ARUDO